MASEEKTMLSQKLSEMSSRWKGLQNKMLDINLMLQKSSCNRISNKMSIIDVAAKKEEIWILFCGIEHLASQAIE